jgi:hypothetical protein
MRQTGPSLTTASTQHQRPPSALGQIGGAAGHQLGDPASGTTFILQAKKIGANRPARRQVNSVEPASASARFANGCQSSSTLRQRFKLLDSTAAINLCGSHLGPARRSGYSSFQRWRASAEPRKNLAGGVGTIALESSPQPRTSDRRIVRTTSVWARPMVGREFREPRHVRTCSARARCTTSMRNPAKRSERRSARTDAQAGLPDRS